jgi:hypothetical protein
MIKKVGEGRQADLQQAGHGGFTICQALRLTKGKGGEGGVDP